MKLASIKIGLWYETTKGIGECVRTASSFPPSVGIRIDAPMRRGILYLSARDVLREVAAPKNVKTS